MKTLTTLTDQDFNHYDSGKIIAGLQWKIKTEFGNESHETYQFDSLADVTECAKAFIATEGMREVKVVTHAGGYRKMRTLCVVEVQPWLA